MATEHGYATLADLESIMEVDFSADFNNAAGVAQIAEATIDARGSVIENFMIGVIGTTYTSLTIPYDVKAYFLKAWEMDCERFLVKRGIEKIVLLEDDDWREIIQGKFGKVLDDDIAENTIANYDSIMDYDEDDTF